MRLACDRKSFDRCCRIAFKQIPLDGFFKHMLDDRKSPIHGNRIQSFALFRFPFFDLPRGNLRKGRIAKQESKLINGVFLRFPSALVAASKLAILFRQL